MTRVLKDGRNRERKESEGKGDTMADARLVWHVTL